MFSAIHSSFANHEVDHFLEKVLVMIYEFMKATLHVK